MSPRGILPSFLPLNYQVENCKVYKEGVKQSMTDQPMVHVSRLSKTIDGEEIIRDLSFSIRRGEICGLLGPNGAGKTLTIRMIVGLTPPTSGDILIGGASITTERAKALEQIGVIVETPDMYGYMTGMQNLKHFARMYTPAISMGRIQEVVRLVELTDAIDRKVKTYSLGMRQRLGIAQALLHRPGVLILDEPTNGLDPSGIHQLRTYLHTLARTDNIAIIVSSHLLSEVELMCDRAIIIQNGTLIAEHAIKSSGPVRTEETVSVMLEVAEPERALDILSSLHPVLQADRTLALTVDKVRIPGLVEQLVQHRIGVYQVMIRSASLEEMFLSVTGGTRLP